MKYETVFCLFYLSVKVGPPIHIDMAVYSGQCFDARKLPDSIVLPGRRHKRLDWAVVCCPQPILTEIIILSFFADIVTPKVGSAVNERLKMELLFELCQE